MFQTQLFVLKQKKREWLHCLADFNSKNMHLDLFDDQKSIANQITGRFPFFLDFSLHISQYFILKAIDDELKLWFEFYLALLILRCTWQWALNVQIARNHILSILFFFLFFALICFSCRDYSNKTPNTYTLLLVQANETTSTRTRMCIFGSCWNVVHKFNARQTV